MKGQIKTGNQQKQEVLDKISENDGEIIYNNSILVKAIFPDNKIEQTVRIYFEITERLNQKAELSGGNRLTVYLT
jgi:hypothetical protein